MFNLPQLKEYFSQQPKKINVNNFGLSELIKTYIDKQK